MKEWKKALLVLLAVAVLSVVSHRGLAKRPVDVLVVKAEGQKAEAYRVRLFLNGEGSVAETVGWDEALRKRAVRVVEERDREGLEDLARELGGFRFAVGMQGLGEGWPWYLKGADRGDRSFGTPRLLDRLYLSLAAGDAPSPRFTEAKAEEGKPEAGREKPVIDIALDLEMDDRPGVTPTPPAAPAAVKMEILNDCGIKGAADGIALAVKRPGVDILQVGNTKRFRYRRTHFQSSVGVPVVLQEILEEMGIPENEVQEIPPGRRQADVVLVVGRDYRKILERMRDRTSH